MLISHGQPITTGEADDRQPAKSPQLLMLSEAASIQARGNRKEMPVKTSLPTFLRFDISTLKAVDSQQAILISFARPVSSYKRVYHPSDNYLFKDSHTSRFYSKYNLIISNVI